VASSRSVVASLMNSWAVTASPVIGQQYITETHRSAGD
jgi:hypothetical protein